MLTGARNLSSVKGAMRGRKGSRMFGLVALLVCMAAASSARPSGPLPASNLSLASIGALPLSFSAGLRSDAGQAVYTARAAGGTIHFEPTGLTLALPGSQSDPDTAQPEQRTLAIDFLNSHAAQVTSGERLPGTRSYYLGSDPSAWQTNLPTYSSITYSALYSGIDLRYEGTDGSLKGTYTLAPGAAPADIRWGYTGAEVPTLDEAGNLTITFLPVSGLRPGEIKESAPVAWQGTAKGRVPVDVSYTVAPDGTVGFNVGDYDSALPLVIDPTLTYSSYYGTPEEDEAVDMDIDSAGNIYMLGSTNNYDDFWDLMVTKLSPAGNQVLYEVILGGTRLDLGAAMEVDADGNANVMGNVTSNNFPILNAIQSQNLGSVELTITRLNPTGGMIWSTYLGTPGAEAGSQMALDNAGNIYLVGSTDEPDFPMVNPYQPNNAGMIDSFVTGINVAGTALLFSTYFGGEYDDDARDIWVDAANHIYITGFTRSSNLPVQNAFQPEPAGDGDAFVTKFTPQAQALVWSTYLGGENGNLPGPDYGEAIRTDADNNVYVTGYTEAPNFPTTLGSFQPFFHGGLDAFVTKFAADGQSLAWSTYLGGTGTDPQGRDRATSITVDEDRYVYVTGSTYSLDFPVANAVQPTLEGRYDAFVTKFVPDGSDVAYSTFLGGTYNIGVPGQTGDDIGMAITTDAAGNAVIMGTTGSYNFPTINAYKYDIEGNTDYFLSKIEDENLPPTATPTGTPPTATPTSSTPSAFPTFTPTPTVTPICGQGTYVFEGSITQSDPFATDVLYLDEIASSCAAPKTCAGTIEDRVAYDQYRFTNTTGAPQCITVHLDGTECGIAESVTSAAYLGSFDPSNACANYLADGGTDSFWYTGPITYSFTVPEGESFSVVVQELNEEIGCETYTLTVSGLDSSCPTATMTPTNAPPTSTGTNTAVATQTSTPVATGTPASTGTAQGTAQTSSTVTTTPAITTTPTACTVTFNDVPDGSTFYSYVMCLACHGVINGYPDGTFRPSNPVTRGQLSKIVMLSAGVTDPVQGQTFEDVLPGSTFYAYIERMAGREIVSGYPCGGAGEPCGVDSKPYFRPNADTTRGQIAKIVSIAAGFSTAGGTRTFEDVPEGHSFHPWIEALASRGYIGGYPCGGPGEPCGPSNMPYFRPGSGATRGQLSKIVAQAFFPGCTPGR